jgi:hypothetical protein
MPDEVDIFERFRRRPAMFTGENTINSIRCYLDGYHFAMEWHGLSPVGDPLLVPGEFHDWVAYRLHFYESTSGWCNMIRDRTGTEQEGIDKFFELLAEFKVRTPRVVARVTHCKQTYGEQTYEPRDDEVILGAVVERPYPESISLVTYTDDPGFFAYSDTSDDFAHQGYYPDLEAFELSVGVDRSLIVIVDKTWDPKPFPRESWHG